jgi:hypothetical protein
MTQRLRLLYPFLFVLLPILSILTRSPGESALEDVAVLAAVVLVCCAVLYGLVALVLRGRASRLVPPLVVLACILWFHGYDALSGWAHRLGRGPAALGMLCIAAGATMAAVWWLARRPRYLEKATTFLGLTGLLLVGWSSVQFVRDEIAARRTILNSSLARDLARPISPGSRVSSSGAEPNRDIYLIVLDEYANSSVLKERFGFGQEAFEDSLRRLGFTIPLVVRSNYFHTILSLPSLLNFSHLTRLTSELGPRATDPSLPNYLLENNRSVAFLKAQGYRFLFFPSQWWLSTHDNRNADWVFQPWSGVNVGREATRSDLRRAYLRGTVLDLVRQDHGHDADHVRRTLEALARVPDDPRPTFTFAHILNPHRPFVFDAECRTLKAREMRGESGYVGQVQCLDSLLLVTIATLIQRSSPSPIILLQGDHGTKTLDYSSARSAGEISPEQARERFGAFGAYYVPAGGSSLFSDSVTVVNVMAKVLDYYFNAGIPLAPDSLYMSLERSPYLFAPADPASLAGPLPALKR